MMFTNRPFVSTSTDWSNTEKQPGFSWFSPSENELRERDHNSFHPKLSNMGSVHEAMTLGSPPNADVNCTSSGQKYPFMPCFLLGESSQTGNRETKQVNFYPQIGHSNQQGFLSKSEECDLTGPRNSSLAAHLISSSPMTESGSQPRGPNSIKRNVSWKMSAGSSASRKQDEEDRRNYVQLMRHNGKKPPPKKGLNASTSGCFVRSNNASLSQISFNSPNNQSFLSNRIPPPSPQQYSSNNTRSGSNRRIPGGLYSPTQLEFANEMQGDWEEKFEAGEAEARHWVTVFGFPQQDVRQVLEYFSKLGRIVHQTVVSSGNWAHIRYHYVSSARKALTKNGELILNKFMIGVKPCAEQALMNQLAAKWTGEDENCGNAASEISNCETPSMFTSCLGQVSQLSPGPTASNSAQPAGDTPDKENQYPSAKTNARLKLESGVSVRNLSKFGPPPVQHSSNEGDTENEQSFLGRALGYVFGK